MMNDLRLALRLLLKSPSFTAIAVLTLALGIGGNTAIFSVLNALLLEPLPFPDSQRIVQIDEQPNNFPNPAPSTGGVFMEWEDHATQLEAIAAFHNYQGNLTGLGDPVRVFGAEVTANYLTVLRLKPELGRGFLPSDDAPGGNRNVVILSHECWLSRFQGDTAVVGKSFVLDGTSLTIIGVLPPRALLLPTVEFLKPAAIRADAWKQSHDYNYPCVVTGRLKSGVTPQQIAAELNAAKKPLLNLYPSYRQPWTVAVRPMQEAVFGNARPTVMILLAAVGAVLLIACANVANLLLARAASRQTEFSVRFALGASRWRIVRQLLLESLALALLGGLAGLLLGAWAIKPLAAFTGLNQLQGLSIGVDVRVFLFTMGASLFTGVLFGLLPALSAIRSSLSDDLKDGGRGGSSGARRKLQSLLVIAETALTVVLLGCAGLLLRSFERATAAEAGFQRDKVLTFTVNPSGNKVPTTEARTQYVRDILRNIAELPGVSQVGMASSTPMNGQTGFGDIISREDQPDTRNNLRAGYDAIQGDFFRALGVPLLRGRFFTDADNSERASKVIILNDVIARQLFGQKEAVGELIHFRDAVWQVVGVVGSVRQFSLDVDPTPHVYFPQAYFPWSTMVTVRTQVPPLTLAADIRRAVHAVDPEVPVSGLATLEQQAEATLRSRRIFLMLIGIFAGTALVLACIGIYGVMAYSVAQRTREIGIRVALGANHSNVVSLVMGNGLKLVAIGLGIGAVASYGAGRLIASQLYSTSQWDLGVFISVAVILSAVAALACWVPARRATLVNPVEALRAE